MNKKFTEFYAAQAIGVIGAHIEELRLILAAAVKPLIEDEEAKEFEFSISKKKNPELYMCADLLSQVIAPFGFEVFYESTDDDTYIFTAKSKEVANISGVLQTDPNAAAGVNNKFDNSKGNLTLNFGGQY